MATQPTGDSGMELRDLIDDREFRSRKLRVHEPNAQAKAFLRMAHVFAENPPIVLEELVNTAVTY